MGHRTATRPARRRRPYQRGSLAAGTTTPGARARPRRTAQRGRGPAGAVFRVTTLSNQTVRMIVRTSIGGRRARVKLSNAFGSTPVIVGAAHLARRGTASSIMPGTDRALTFAGKASFTMMPGAVIVSDPVDIEFPALGDLAISLYLPSDTGPPTDPCDRSYTRPMCRPKVISPAQSEFPLAGTTQQYYWVSSVEVAAAADAAAIVAFGDSITDGARSTPDTNNSWPALLAARLGCGQSHGKYRGRQRRHRRESSVHGCDRPCGRQRAGATRSRRVESSRREVADGSRRDQ